MLYIIVAKKRNFNNRIKKSATTEQKNRLKGGFFQLFIFSSALTAVPARSSAQKGAVLSGAKNPGL